jgi:hypothetical protein
MNLKKIPYIISLCRKRASEGHLPAYRQLLEIVFLQSTRGIGYDIYHYAGMWDKGASWDYKCSFLSYKAYGKKIHELNERKFHGMSQYKPYEKVFSDSFPSLMRPILARSVSYREAIDKLTF